MKLSQIPESLEGAAEKFVALLSPQEKATLTAISSISPLLKGGAEFIGAVVREFRLKEPEALPLLRSIHRCNRGDVTNMDFMAEAADPMIAARLIVERVQKKLLEEAK